MIGAVLTLNTTSSRSPLHCPKIDRSVADPSIVRGDLRETSILEELYLRLTIGVKLVTLLFNRNAVQPKWTTTWGLRTRSLILSKNGYCSPPWIINQKCRSKCCFWVGGLSEFTVEIRLTRRMGRSRLNGYLEWRVCDIDNPTNALGGATDYGHGWRLIRRLSSKIWGLSLLDFEYGRNY